MQNLMRELEGVMSEELGLYVGLLQYAKGKKEALINNDVDEISRLAKLESESLERIKCTAIERERVFSTIAASTVIPVRLISIFLHQSCPCRSAGSSKHSEPSISKLLRN